MSGNDLAASELAFADIYMIFREKDGANLAQRTGHRFLH